jgi:homoserine O-acetyltransferase
VGITSDMLFPNWQVEEISFLASKAGVRACYDEIESDDGHDAFLTDQNQLDDIIRSFWKKTNLN